MSARNSSDGDAWRRSGGQNLKSNEDSGEVIYISFGTSPRQEFEVKLDDCIPCEVAKSIPSNIKKNH